MREDRSSHHDQGMDKYIAPAATYQMTVRDYVVRPSASSAIVISLPPVGEARGRIYTIIAQLATNTNTITIRPFTSTGFVGGDAERWEANVVLNEKGRGATFYSDGMKWHYGGLTFTSSLVAGAVNLQEVNLTMDTGGAANPDAFKVVLDSEVVLGNSAGAIFAQVNYSETAARVQGLTYAIGAEMILPNHAAIASGHYCCQDFELSAGDICDWPVATVVSYMRFAAWGTQTNIDDNAFFFTLAGAELVDHMISATAQTIRIRIQALTAGINKERFIVLSDTQDVISMTGTMAAATTKCARFTPTVNNMAMGDGYGCFEIEVTSTGTDADWNAAMSAWMTVNSTTGGHQVVPVSVGIWENAGSTGVITGARIIAGMRIQAILTNAAERVCMFSFNSNAAGVPYAMIDCTTFAGAGATANVNEAGACWGYYPILIENSASIRWVRLYSAMA